MLRIEGLVVSYGDKTVLHQVSLQLQRGEMRALIGPNGAGKSTLLRAISGVISVARGEIRVGEMDLRLLSPLQRARYLAVVPQAASLPPAFTVWETVLLGRTPYLNFFGQISRRDEEIARLALQKVEALSLAEQRIGELSGGEQQRILLARALAQSTPILLLDEPTSHLDLHYQLSFLELVRQLAREDHLAVLIALHDLNLASRYADSITLLVEGRVHLSGTPVQVLQPEVLSSVYRWPVQVISHPWLHIPLVLPSNKDGDRARAQKDIRAHYETIAQMYPEHQRGNHRTR